MDKEGHLKMIKGSVHQEDITNVYACNNRASKYTEQSLTIKIDKSTIIL